MGFVGFGCWWFVFDLVVVSLVIIVAVVVVVGCLERLPVRLIVGYCVWFVGFVRTVFCCELVWVMVGVGLVC